MAKRDRPQQRTSRTVDIAEQTWGSDLVADYLKAAGYTFVSFNPGASFRGIEESIVNYNENVPEVITTTHEGLSVSIAHGYAKATNDVAVCCLHDVVGTLHGAMSLYNAYVDRVPILALSGTGPLRKSKRRPWIDWVHSALDQGGLVREIVKWDDQPMHVDGALESLLRAERRATTPPMGPVYLTFDHDIQEGPVDDPIPIPSLEGFRRPSRIGPDPEAIEEAVDMLVDADLPVILVDQVGDSRDAVRSLVTLAETLGAPVIDARKRRFNFPNTHSLDLTGTEVYRDADVVLAIDKWGVNDVIKDVDRTRHELTEGIEGEFDLIEVGLDDIEASSLTTDYYGLRETAVSILAESELAVPALCEAIEERLAAATTLRAVVDERIADLSERHDDRRETWAKEAEDAWDETPISVPRIARELWSVIEDEDWVVVNGSLRGWIHRLWEIDEFDQYIGGSSGGAGTGYGIGAAIGGALAYVDSDRIPINLQPDGGLMFYPGGLWTIAHHDIPILTVVHNNHTYYNSTQHRMRLAEYRGRDASYERALIGTGLNDPVPDYAAMAEAVGINGYGPIEDPDALGVALADAWTDVVNGRPALVDVVAQPR